VYYQKNRDKLCKNYLLYMINCILKRNVIVVISIENRIKYKLSNTVNLTEAVEYARHYRASNEEEIREHENIYDVTTHQQDIKKGPINSIFRSYTRRRFSTA